MFFKDVVDKLKQRGFVKANGENDFDKFLIDERLKHLKDSENNLDDFKQREQNGEKS